MVAAAKITINQTHQGMTCCSGGGTVCSCGGGILGLDGIDFGDRGLGSGSEDGGFSGIAGTGADGADGDPEAAYFTSPMDCSGGR